MKFKDRYVLAEGYPDRKLYITKHGSYFNIGMCYDENKEIHDIFYVPLYFPKEFLSKRVPKYRLVLEKIND